MSAKYRHEGRAYDYTPGSDVDAGTVVDLGSGMVGVANNPIPANIRGALATSGVFSITKAAPTDVFTLGQAVTVNDTAGGQVTNVAGTGRVARPSANGDLTAWVEINVGLS